ncbi:retrovirus-related pol polyprotein from transposon tnt 1-94 [Nephila pilipes]|uniref:Retrovirus-related pol polyprotein from transposon tnt 1-94 n=1 Tax=Nephila pilipes TaxID=299642 RepID=A0A8X6IBJ1_NEPPI|nr:retrovirus-related pol polyprotein from transposon tnt 1-94 [Nephila pilipes]
MVKEVLSDGGGEIINSTVKSVLKNSGISFRMSMPYTPQQNGAAECENRTIVESARSMIYATNLHLKLWAEAVNTCAPDVSSTDIQNSDKEIVKKPLQTPDPDVAKKKKMEEICSAEDTEETLAQQSSRNLHDISIL